MQSGGELDGEFIFKTHNAGGMTILAACDAGIIGKSIRFRDVDFKVNSSFYGQARTGRDGIVEKVKSADIVNVVGKSIVDLLVKSGLVREDCVLSLGDGTPHVQIVRI